MSDIERPAGPTAKDETFFAVHAHPVKETEHGLRIGEDLSVVCFNNSEYCEYLTPPLTSISEDEWAGLGFSENVQIKDIVVHLARLAQKAGLAGVVASPQEAAMIREACGKDFLIVTPGVRPAGSSLDDQSRIATPASALRAGATHLVIGRPIRAAENPVKAAQDIIKEMEQVK